MKCEHCGTEHEGSSAEMWLQCRDALAAQLAERDAEIARLKACVTRALYRDEVEDGEPDDYNEAVDWWHEMVKCCREALAASPAPTEKK